MDSNHRSNLQQIYSLSPLATREAIHIKADERTRTVNLLITNQLLCQLSHIGLVFIRLRAARELSSLARDAIAYTMMVSFPRLYKYTFNDTIIVHAICFSRKLSHIGLLLDIFQYLMGPTGLEPVTLCL